MEAHLHQKKKKKAKAKTIASHDLSNWNAKIKKKQIKIFGLDLFFKQTSHVIDTIDLLDCFLSTFWQKWASMLFPSQWRSKKKQEKNQTQNTWWGLQKLKRAQAQHQHNAFYSPKFQIHLKYTSAPFERSRNGSTFRFGGQMWNKTNLYLQDKREEQKNPQIVDCAFDYLGLIRRKVAAVRP